MTLMTCTLLRPLCCGLGVSHLLRCVTSCAWDEGHRANLALDLGLEAEGGAHVHRCPGHTIGIRERSQGTFESIRASQCQASF